MGKFIFNPFKKNRYFYGKRLNVTDFKIEQSYNEAKRHMLNRNISGAGIVYGLNVEQETDSQTLRISAGLAIDGYGREIVVPEGIKVMLPDISGVHHNFTGSQNFLLFIKYDEQNAEPAAISQYGEIDSSSYDYSRLLEGFSLEIKHIEDGLSASMPNLFYSSVEIYNNGQVKLTRLAPVWINPNEVFRVMLIAERIENTTVTPKEIEFVITETMEGQLGTYETSDKSKNLTIKLGPEQKRYYTSYFAKSLFDPHPGSEESVGSIKLSAFNGLQAKFITTRSVILSVATPISDKFLEKYFTDNYFDLLPMADDEYVCLAEINITTQAKSSSMPDTLQIPPVITVVKQNTRKNRQFVYNNSLLYQLIRNIEARIAYQKMPPIIKDATADIKYNSVLSAPDVRADYDKQKSKLDFHFTLPRQAESGVVVFDVYADHLREGDYDISESINPGADISVESIQVVWDRSLYTEQYGEKLTYGILPDKGSNTFQIWYKAAETFTFHTEAGARRINQLHFRWWAYKGTYANKDEVRAQSLVMRPKRVNLEAGGNKSANFEVYFGKTSLSEVKHGTLKWKAFDKDNKLIGEITKGTQRLEVNTGSGIVTSRIFMENYLNQAYAKWKENTFEFIVECEYEVNKVKSKARAFVGMPKEFKHKLEVTLPALNTSKFIDLSIATPFIIRWKQMPDISFYKINLRIKETSAIIYSETVPGDCTGISIRRECFSYSEALMDCVLDIFAYYSPTEFQYGKYDVRVGFLAN